MQEIPFGSGRLFQSDSDPAALIVYICSRSRQDYEALLPAGQAAYALALFPVDDWNRELSPWAAPAVFGEEAFAGEAASTLHRLESALDRLPEPLRALPAYLCGYSLGGLFALWALHESPRFAGCAAVSGSFWFPGLCEYVRSRPLPPETKVYLSLGKKEAKSRSRQMRTVGESLQELSAFYSLCCCSVLEWNEGNHFTDPVGRTLRGIRWLLQ